MADGPSLRGHHLQAKHGDGHANGYRDGHTDSNTHGYADGDTCSYGDAVSREPVLRWVRDGGSLCLVVGSDGFRGPERLP